MKTFSRRKFVETAVMSGAGVTVLADIAKGQDGDNGIISSITPSDSETLSSQASECKIIEAPQTAKGIPPPDFSNMRPIRKKQAITVTVGQKEGDFQGMDDKVLQAAVDYVSNLGGGTVHIMPGVYSMSNSLSPRKGILIHGSGDKTILRKNPSVSSKIIRESDWFEYGIKVEDPQGFTVGGGLVLSTDGKDPGEVHLFTVTAIQGNAIYLDKLTEKDYWMMDGARASTRFSVINGLNTDDVQIEDLVADGNRSENEWIDNDYVSAVYLKSCNRWTFRNVVARNYNSDGFSFQVCDDIHFENCSAINNADYGFHPGSGSQRPVFKHCTARGNSQGFYWCWGACDGIAEDCISVENLKYGVNFGHRDTDNILRNCVIESNGEIGVLFRKEENEYRTADRNLLENCIIRNNGKTGSGLGIDIRWMTSDITVRNCQIENTNDGPQKVGIQISSEAQRITLENNRFSGCKVNVDDQRKSGKI